MNKLTTDKNYITYFVALCAAYGLRKVIISPGSRSAPLTVAFHCQAGIDCYVIPDERSASYFAIGMAQFTREPVGIICTSGTAALNYAPALAEAFHQKLPIIAITADRPPEWVGQQDGQTIDQIGIYRNFVAYQAQIPVSVNSTSDNWLIERIVRDGFVQLLKKRLPVHFNVPLREPLYSMETYVPVVVKPALIETTVVQVPGSSVDIRKYKKVMIVAGMHRPDPDLLSVINKIAFTHKVVILRENLSNIDVPGTFSTSDALLFSLNEQDDVELKPDLVISFGDMLLSKPLKIWIRNLKNAHHWIVTENEQIPDVFQNITKVYPLPVVSFLQALSDSIDVLNLEFFQKWESAYHRFNVIQMNYLDKVPWSDIKVFKVLAYRVPEDSFVHLGNSSPVRYAQFFSWNRNIAFFANRGTAGIDGCTSTAIGMATLTDKIVTMITGDVSFLYDSNALWNNYKKENFKIILINNKGGNIFNLISGPDNTGLLNEYFITHVPVSVEHLCKAYGVGYIKAENAESLSEAIEQLYSNRKCTLLEVHTELAANTLAWKDYFKTVKTKMTYE